MKDSNGKFCTTPEASINLMDTHFPGSKGRKTKPCVAHTLTEIENPEVEFISQTRVRRNNLVLWRFETCRTR